MHQTTAPVSPEDVFATLGDKYYVEILNAVYAELHSTTNGMATQTKKQYYVTLKQLVNMGLVEKQKSVYKLTTFGSIVYENNLKTIEKVIPNYWQIKSIDVLKARNDFPVEQKEKIIDEYIATSGMYDIINATLSQVLMSQESLMI